MGKEQRRVGNNPPLPQMRGIKLKLRGSRRQFGEAHVAGDEAIGIATLSD